MWAHEWFGFPNAVGTHPARCLSSSSLYGFGAGSLVGVLRCSCATALGTVVFYPYTIFIYFILFIYLAFSCTSILALLYFETALGTSSDFYYTSS